MHAAGKKFVWILKNVGEGLACRMSFAFPFKMLGEKCKCFISSKLYGLFTQSCTLRPSAGCDDTTLVFSLQADTVLMPHVFIPVAWQGGYISKK